MGKDTIMNISYHLPVCSFLVVVRGGLLAGLKVGLPPMAVDFPRRWVQPQILPGHAHSSEE